MWNSSAQLDIEIYLTIIYNIYITRNRIQHLDSLAVTIAGIRDDLSREINGIFFFFLDLN